MRDRPYHDAHGQIRTSHTFLLIMNQARLPIGWRSYYIVYSIQIKFLRVVKEVHDTDKTQIEKFIVRALSLTALLAGRQAGRAEARRLRPTHYFLAPNLAPPFVEKYAHYSESHGEWLGGGGVKSSGAGQDQIASPRARRSHPTQRAIMESRTISGILYTPPKMIGPILNT